MKIDLTRRDYQSLLTVLEIADWVLHAYSPEEPPEQQEAMKQAIISAMSPEEQNQINEYRDNLQNFQQEFLKYTPTLPQR
jgi:hypothetical protein